MEQAFQDHEIKIDYEVQTASTDFGFVVDILHLDYLNEEVDSVISMIVDEINEEDNLDFKDIEKTKYNDKWYIKIIYGEEY